MKDRFWAKVNKTDTCWLWTASCFRDGYGQFKLNKKNLKAHRLSYYIAHGTWPENSLVCHTCDNPKCVNPAHLFLGSPRDNSLDRDKKGRQVKAENVNTAKLTIEQVIEIRTKYQAKNITQVELSLEYGVTQTAISCIILRKTWKSV